MTYVAMNERGYPVATSDDIGAAREFVWQNSGCGVELDHLTHTSRWTPTGKLYFDGVWTGWEIREVKQL